MSGTITLDSPHSIAAIYPHEPQHFNAILGQIEERIQLIREWDIQPGEKVLEIGGGQGDCTVTLAAAVGEKGSVTAIDPAPLDYGSPYTLGQAHDHLLASPLGSRVNFVQADPLTFLQDTSESYDTAVLAHCIYYLASPAVLSAILAALATRAQRICLAEYALTASDPRAVPHVLAVLTHASLECRLRTCSTGVGRWMTWLGRSTDEGLRTRSKMRGSVRLSWLLGTVRVERWMR